MKEKKCPLRVHPYSKSDSIPLCPLNNCLHILLPGESICPCHLEEKENPVEESLRKTFEEATLEEKKCEHKVIEECVNNICISMLHNHHCRDCGKPIFIPFSPSDKTWEEPSIEYIAKDFINSIEGTDKDWKIRRLIDLLTSATIKAKAEKEEIAKELYYFALDVVGQYGGDGISTSERAEIIVKEYSHLEEPSK